jgi:hypothetical protein
MFMEIVELLAERLKQNPDSVGVCGNVFRACPPASEVAVAATEKQLGFNLPQTLRRIYLKVANGGFGPGYGVMGVAGGFADDLGHTVGDLFEVYRRGDPEDPEWNWPERFLPICHWGCVVYSALDCRDEQTAVYLVDVSGKEPGEPMDKIIKLQTDALERWLRDWLEGKDLWASYRSRS